MAFGAYTYSKILEILGELRGINADLAAYESTRVVKQLRINIGTILKDANTLKERMRTLSRPNMTRLGTHLEFLARDAKIVLERVQKGLLGKIDSPAAEAQSFASKVRGDLRRVA